MTEKINNVMVNINGEETLVHVKHQIPLDDMAKIAKVTANGVVTEEGEYNPWYVDIFHAMGVLAEYTDMQVPENWTDVDMLDFIADGGFIKIEGAIQELQMELIRKWERDLIEARKDVFFRNPVGGIGKILEGLMEKNRVDINP